MGTSTRASPRRTSVRSSTGSMTSVTRQTRCASTTWHIPCADRLRRSTCNTSPRGLYTAFPLGPAPMPREVRDDEEDEESEGLWKGLVRDLLVAGIIVVIVLVGIYVYTGVWPPLVVVESQSMQHSGTESYFGVIDTGDMVFQQAAPNRADVVTYLEGRASGYATYGDYGDVIIFRHASDPTPVIHRAIMYVTLHNNGTYATADVDRLSQLTGWEATTDSGPITCPPTCSGLYLRTLTIHRMGRPGGPEEQLGQPRREPRRPLRVPVHPRVRGPGMEEIRFTAPPGDPVAVAARQDETGEEKATRGRG